jgi:gas vesicle protein
MERKEINGRVGAFLLGSAIGSVIAAAVTLLITPQSGEETQTKIKSKVLDLREDAEHTLTKGQQSAESAVVEVRNSLADWLQQRASMLEEQAGEIKASTK